MLSSCVWKLIKKMSILNYFRKIDSVPSDKNEGLNELLRPKVLKEVNSEMRKVEKICTDSLYLGKCRFMYTVRLKGWG